MNRYLKIILVCLLSFVGFLVLGVGIISHCYRDEVVRFVIESINKQVTSRIDVQSVHFSIISKFPNASVEFKNVAMSPAKDFDTLSFEPAISRQLLSAESVFAEMNLLRLLTGNYLITRIELRNGHIHLLTDKNNRPNFIFWKTSEKTNESSSFMELQNVTLINTDVYYGHQNTVLSLHTELSRLSGRLSSLQYSLSADWQGSVRLFSMAGDVLIRDKDMALSGKLDADSGTFTIRQTELALADIKMAVTGSFSATDGIDLDLLAEGKQMDYASLVSALPEQYRQKLLDYPGNGHIDFAASVKGRVGNGLIPHIEAQFGMQQGQISHRKSKVKLTGLSFSGTFTTGDRNRRASCALQINNFGCNFGGGTVRGNLTMQNFAKPQITARITGNTDLGQLYRFIPAQQMTAANGRITCDLTAAIRLKKLIPTIAGDISQLNLEGSTRFDNGSIALRNPSWRFSRINGTLQFGNRITASKLSLLLNGNDFQIDGYLDGWSPYLLKQRNIVHLKANVQSQLLSMDSLLIAGTSAPKKPSSAKTTAPTTLFPANINAEATLNAATFRYQKFEATTVRAQMVYRQQALEIRSVDFAAMAGKVTGSGIIACDKYNHLQVRGETELNRMEVGQLFRSFDNFGQDVLRAEHVNGRLSGDVGFAMGWDEQMRLLRDNLAVEGLLNLDGGELLDFDALNNLSRFVALDELKNIRFSRLNMRVSIKDNKIAFPQTDVLTSAFDMAGSGEHHFNNSYTYRIKILLSELLAAKARKAKRENRENEYADNDSKRTALYLKIAGQGTNFKIAYDKQLAMESVAADIRNEKQKLKTVLHEEFGWFKKDSTTHAPATENAGKLKFTFEDE